MINARHQDRRGDVGIALLKFAMGQKTCDMERADGVADGHDLVAAAAEQVDVLVDPRGRSRDILGTGGPGVSGGGPGGWPPAPPSPGVGETPHLLSQPAPRIATPSCP